MSWSGPKNPKRTTCGVKATGKRAKALRARMKLLQERHKKGLDPFKGARSPMPLAPDD